MTPAAEPQPAPGAVLADYDVVAFDCDGVLLDSNRFKIDLFVEVLRAEGISEPVVAAFSAFQSTNFGTSRYRLFEFLEAGRFGDAGGVTAAHMLAAFGEACFAGYLATAEAPGLRDALVRAGGDGRSLYVVSGSDEAELRRVLEARGLASAFAQVLGSPANKTQNLTMIRERETARLGRAPRILFVGDAFADLAGADDVGADFLFAAAMSTVRPALEARIRQRGLPMIEDLRELV
ncbi:HAD family hydrolase [uncultured Sphingomonas sp.]|uniref:HAD family hydrolase n=1 Tax=uncultured Sphingomonas sp. TaxID=158754 RepID=UPI0025FFF91C|nr:HAD family hydrolase [uncultured Sphingomonas sp.]